MVLTCVEFDASVVVAYRRVEFGVNINGNAVNNDPGKRNNA